MSAASLLSLPTPVPTPMRRARRMEAARVYDPWSELMTETLTI